MAELLIAEEHDQLYQVLRQRGVRNAAVAHIDFHCDMRGLMIDRPRGVAYLASQSEKQFIDPGNWLSHAIMNGFVSSVRWVHDPHGGRRYDEGTVKYESDHTAFAHRLLHRWRGDDEVKIAFEELYFGDWDGVRSGEYLDIDWDALASSDYQLSHIRKLVSDFLNRRFPVIPEVTSLVFSPNYSFSDRNLFEEFAARLSEKFSAEIVRLQSPSQQPEPEAPSQSPSRHILDVVRRSIPEPIKARRRQFLDGLRAYQTRNDVNLDIR